MSRNRDLVFKITTASSLAALSIVLKISFDMWIPINTFGFPFYSIPLILAGMYLGPYYALMVGFIADTIGGMYPGPYLPLFLFSSLAWSLIPSLLSKDTKGIRWWIVIAMTYLTATAFNTLAIYVHFSWGAVMSNLALRFMVMPLFIPIIAIVTKYIYERLEIPGNNIVNKK